MSLSQLLGRRSQDVHEGAQQMHSAAVGKLDAIFASGRTRLSFAGVLFFEY